MKVLQIGKFLPPHKGGMEHSILHLCRELQKAGFEVVLGAAGETHEGQRKESFRFRPFRELFRFASTPIHFGIRKALREENPDLIHVHLPNPWWTLFLLFERRPMIATYHCDIVTYPILKWLYRPFLNLFLSRCYAIIATSPHLMENNPDLLRFKSKTRMISLTVPPMTLSERGREVRDRLRQEHGERLILFVGRLVPYKGLHYLIQAMRDVQGKVLIVGKGPLLDELVELSGQLSVKQKVIFAGAVSDEDLPAYYHAATTVVLPSISEAEALGVCLIEALSADKALVTTDLNTGVRYVNQDQVTGLMVPVKNAEMLARALNRLLDSQELRRTFEQNASLHYKSHFSSEVIVQAYSLAYQEAIKATKLNSPN